MRDYDQAANADVMSAYSKAEMTAAIEISLAGRVAIARTGDPGGETGLGSRARVAFAFLALERWRAVTHDELAEVVWGVDLPPTWRAALRGVVSRIRRALAAAGLEPNVALTSSPGGYQLHLPSGSTVDVELARQRLHDGRALAPTNPLEARMKAERAVATLRGEFLGGLEGAWVERLRLELSELRLQALEVLSQARTSCGDTDGAVCAAEEAVALQPLRESAHLCAMAAHAAAGNRARALRAYERCRRILAEELGVAPGPDVQQAYMDLLGEEPANDNRPPRRRAPGNLPAPRSSFIGRTRERAEVCRLLGLTRLLTITGTGGAGKSRLGLEVVSEVVDDYPDGVWLVELAGVGDGRLVGAQVQAVLQVPDQYGCSALDSLAMHLEPRRMLLVLDNCEHVVASCASVADRLLRSCPEVKIVATSREPLCLDGETVWVIPPLSMPGRDEGGPIESFLRYDAAALFVDRAVAAAPGLDLAGMGDAVATICRRLDGIPLALELAAARARSMAVPDIAERLRDRFDLLVNGVRTAPARHQTLRAALDWSYESLPEPERRLFASVSVFAGGFTIDAAEMVCPDGAPAALGTLTRLVDKSLIMTDRSGQYGRYRLLETTRQYGREKLMELGIEVPVRRAQLRWAAALAEAAEDGLEGRDQALWLRRLDVEYDNLQGTLEWAADHPANVDGQRTAAALWRYWEIRGFLREGRARLEALLGVDTPEPLRAKALNGAGVLAQSQGDHRAAESFYTQALDIRRALGDRVGAAAALNGLGNVAVGRDDLFRARAIFEANVAASREIGVASILAGSLLNLGVVAQLLFVSGRISKAEGTKQALALYMESLDHYRRSGDVRGVSQALENLGVLAPYLGDDARAQDCLTESLELRRALCDKSGIAASARFLGHLALRNSHYGAARSLHQECLAISSDLGNEMLMAADLASLAAVASLQGDEMEARRLRGLAFRMTPQVHDERRESGFPSA